MTEIVCALMFAYITLLIYKNDRRISELEEEISRLKVRRVF